MLLWKNILSGIHLDVVDVSSTLSLSTVLSVEVGVQGVQILVGTEE